MSDTTEELQEPNADTDYRCRSCGKLLARGALASASLHIKCTRCGELNSIFEGMVDQVVVTDPEGIILYANSRVEQVTGYSLPEIIGKTPSLWGKQMPGEFYASLWHQIKDLKQSVSVKLQNRRKDGTVYSVQLRISPILDVGGEIKFFVGIETVLPAANSNNQKT
jgi:PAS domain S-box-containing protein